MVSVKKNIVLNSINTITGILFPIVTFPYAARVLLPEGIGAVNFLNSIINYIVLFTSLGIPLYAVKEVAKYSDDIYQRDKVTIEILILSIILCILGYLSVWLLAKYIPQIHEQAALFYILSLTILFTCVGVNWFYQGIEDFKFITIRAVIIRTLAAASLFIFVKTSSDLLIYGVITVGSTVGNNILNFIYLRKRIDFKNIDFSSLKISRHIKPSIHVFILNLIISLYVQLNSIMLGFMNGDDAVGYFTAGTRISHVGLTLIGSLGTVLLPRCSHLLKIGDIQGFSTVIKKSLKTTLALGLPMTVGLMVLAAPVTIIFCGYEYVDAIPVLWLNAPVIIFIGLTNIMGTQILYPMDKVNLVILSVSGAAILNVVLNLILIPRYAATGAAVATLISEFSVLVLQIFLGLKYFPFKIKDLFDINYITASSIMGGVIWVITILFRGYVLELVLGFIIGVIVYVATLLLMKDDFILEIMQTFKRIFVHGK